ncbi:MAG: lyase family protein [Verrucomicrobiae bacterium]|nr:lyase family protein [Verrucomicrobiae bacterium]
MSGRREHDLLGELEIPAEVYWGIHTARALANFPFDGVRAPGVLIKAMSWVKQACCQANRELGYLEPPLADALERACKEVAEGRWQEQFPLSAMQGGAGTSTNMNLNEVLANRALEILGRQRGDYAALHPIGHVNLHQSTNDVYPTALKIAAIFGVRGLSQTAAALQGALQRREKEFAAVVMVGRTEMQEAVPMTMGGQFSSFAEAIARDRWRTFKCEERLRVVNLGGTAVGTGLTAPRDYIFLAIEKLRVITGLGLSRAENGLDQTANADAFVEVSGMLDAHACNLIKMAGDLRRLHFLGEIEMEAVQAGSSVMPGKVNPILTEAVISAGIKARANHGVIAECAARGTFQICEWLPLLASALLENLELLEKADAILLRVVEGLEVNASLCSSRMEESPMLITAFVPEVGYPRAEELAWEYQAGPQGGFRRFLEGRLGKELVDRVLTPENLMALGHRRRP